ncbi:hypothetical protein, partial [Nonomuraea sp. NPDC049784]|uniref:hypothetical protein n=1 Tax=Nonomuraea sp. NPDC049784 TaxID=3154361 RepID=UPI0034003502
GQPGRLSRSRMPAPLRCGALLSGAVCDQPIPQISTSAVSNKLADQQQLVLEVATHRRPALIAGQVVSAGQWFAVLKATAMLVRLGVPEVLPLLDVTLDGQGALAAEVGGQRWNRAGPVGRFGMAERGRDSLKEVYKKLEKDYFNPKFGFFIDVEASGERAANGKFVSSFAFKAGFGYSASFGGVYLTASGASEYHTW